MWVKSDEVDKALSLALTSIDSLSGLGAHNRESAVMLMSAVLIANAIEELACSMRAIRDTMKK